MTDLPHQLEVSSRAFSTPLRIDGNQLSGCLYRENGTKIGISERFGGWKGDWFQSTNPETAEPAGNPDLLPGRSVYLGHYMKHYGHFITESLSAFWIFDHYPAESFDHIVFHSFVFGEGIPSWARFFLSSAGIPLERVRILKADSCRFEEIYVPERLFRLNHSAEPDLISVHRGIAAMCRSEAPEIPKKLYLSRRKQNLRARRRLIANEYQVEQEFSRRGFAVLYPEDMPIKDQIRHYSGAEVIAGPSGSALHNILFAPEGTTLIELADPRYGGKPAPNQEVCNTLAGAKPIFMPFEGRVVGNDMVLLLDRQTLSGRLEANALKVVEKPPKAAFSSAAKGLLEATFFLMRAWIRHVLRRSRR